MGVILKVKVRQIRKDDGKSTLRELLIIHYKDRNLFFFSSLFQIIDVWIHMDRKLKKNVPLYLLFIRTSSQKSKIT